ncbi:MAG TPA: hypothetical protein VIF62_31875 [Labilithrix sp.]|jgi:hypothetical protein
MRAWVAVLFGMLLLLVPTAARAEKTQMLVEVVKGEVKEKELVLVVTTTMREPIAATDSKPTMPPIFTRMELDGVLEKWAPYLLAHTHLIARAKPVEGKVTGKRIVEALEQPIQMGEAERVHGEVTLSYPLAGDDPLTIAFDVLADKEIAPGVPWPIEYTLDIHGPKSKHAEMVANEQVTFDVAEPSDKPTGAAPGLYQSGHRARAIPTGTAVGAIIFIAILYIAYSVLKKRFHR